MDPIDMMVTDTNCEDLGLSKLCLMENAGKCLSDEVAKISTFTFSKPVKIAIFTGSGGNAGDGFVAARHLLNRGFEVEIFTITHKNEIKSDNAKINFEILENMVNHFSRIKITPFDEMDSIDDHIDDYVWEYPEESDNINNINNNNNNSNKNNSSNNSNGSNNNNVPSSLDSFSEYIIIDALLGTGIKGKLKKKFRKAIKRINKSNALKISVDVPSGMDPKTGDIIDTGVKPHYTVCFHKTKSGVKIAGEENTGGLVICDIGIPIEAEIFTGSGDLLRLNTRDSKSHKGNNGKILIVGGSSTYTGAPGISGLAGASAMGGLEASTAISSCVDIVKIACPKHCKIALESYSPDFIVHGLDGDNIGMTNVNDIIYLSGEVDAVLIGPGLGLEEDTKKAVNVLVSKIKKPMVLDADALKLVDINLIKNKEDLIITPHLNEFKHFFEDAVKESNSSVRINKLDNNLDNLNYNQVSDKIAKFQTITKNIKGTVILKGKYDLIFKGNKFKLNKTGNPGMTVGGTGDCLAGLATGLLGQGIDDFDTGILSTYINGKAGDLAKERYGYGFSASKMTRFIGKFMSDDLK
ncbi:MAG: NAD(P)H-hydrate dehydratase [Methanobacteriaceae archaeon]